jgi:hypothetical protein
MATQKLTIAMERLKSHPVIAYLLTQGAFCNSLSDDRHPYHWWFDKAFGNRVVHHGQEPVSLLSSLRKSDTMSPLGTSILRSEYPIVTGFFAKNLLGTIK